MSQYPQESVGNQVPPSAAAPYQKAKGWGIASLVLGILALLLALSGAGAILGVAAGIIGLILGSKARKVLPENERGMATAGWICSIVALALNGLAILFVFGVLSLLGLAAL